MGQNGIANIIARAARGKLLAENEKQAEGGRILKRRILGLCGLKSIKTLDEMARILYDTGIASSVKEGREITPLLMGERVSYACGKEIVFEEVNDGNSNTKYRITAYNYE